MTLTRLPFTSKSVIMAISPARNLVQFAHGHNCLKSETTSVGGYTYSQQELY